MSEQWSAAWQGSKQPRKQRKYRAEAAYHHRGKFVTARLATGLREKVGTKTLPVREGDRVEVMRGDFSGERGEVLRVDRENYTVYVDSVERETVSGSEARVALDPSNLQLVKLNLDDAERVAKYEVAEDELEEIRVEQEPEEDVEEAVDEEDDAAEDESAEESDDVDYDALVEENISDIKGAVEDGRADPEQVLAAEQANKDRVTLVDWLESRIGDDDE